MSRSSVTRLSSFFSCRISFSAEIFSLCSTECGPNFFFQAYRLCVVIPKRFATWATG
jgi:hypothetical protein